MSVQPSHCATHSRTLATPAQQSAPLNLLTPAHLHPNVSHISDVVSTVGIMKSIINGLDFVHVN